MRRSAPNLLTVRSRNDSPTKESVARCPVAGPIRRDRRRVHHQPSAAVIGAEVNSLLLAQSARARCLCLLQAALVAVAGLQL